MGRKPNQLILEYFDRGARLTDNSNRYEQRCKACGERFPKGRAETLIVHIESKCPAIRRRDQALPLTHTYSTPPLTADGDESLHGSIGYVDNGHESTGLHAVLPVSSRPSLTGLEALAEASRRLTHPANQGTEIPPRRQLIDPHLDRVHPDGGNGLGSNGEMRHMIQTQNAALLKFAYTEVYDAYHAAATNGTHARSRAPGPGSNMTLGSLSIASSEPRDHATLSEIAASASSLEAMMPQDNVHRQSEEPVNASQGFPIPHGTVSESHAGSLEHFSSSSPAATPATEQSLGPIPQPISDRPFKGHRHVNGSRQSARASEKPHGRSQKIRGKFTDSRRQEVQNIRKKGACIRCRMLRKTCSGESPCKTCASVISARVWKLDCVRTNVHKELDMFQTGVFAILANQDRERWRDPGSSTSGDCSARYACAAREVASVAFAAQVDLRQLTSWGAVASKPSTLPTPESILFFDETTEQISSKLLQHMHAALSHPSYQDPSPLIGPTIHAALKLIREEFAAPEIPASPAKGQNRKTVAQDKLLALSLDLWALTQVIVSKGDDWWISRPSSSHLPLGDQRQPSAHANNSSAASGQELSASPDILSQLRAAAEQRTASTSKNVMIELEKRLERKEKCQGFGTFLVGILLLNCVERTSWAMKRMSVEDCHDWPLEQPLDHYLDQATHFAEFLSKLYKMRGILVHLRQDPEKGDSGVLQPASAALAEETVIWLQDLHLTIQLSLI
ncbi:MAG: hypothetical protein Q9218_004471 [Villophora microphyllina]